MQRLEVSGAVRPIYGSLGVKRLTNISTNKYCKFTLFVRMLVYTKQFIIQYVRYEHKCRSNLFTKYTNQPGKARRAENWGAFMQPLLVWRSNKHQVIQVFICDLRHAACNAHAPYYHLRPAPLYNTFSSLSHGRQDFWGKNFIRHKMCFDFLYNFVWNISHSKENSARHYKKIYIDLHVKCPYL